MRKWLNRLRGPSVDPRPLPAGRPLPRALAGVVALAALARAGAVEAADLTPPAASAKMRALAVASAPAAAAAAGGGATTTPDLFTGTLATSIKIEVPPGRHDMTPSLALTYRSGAGNGWIGVGWDLPLEAIERSGKRGVDFDGDAYVLSMGMQAVDLVPVGGNEYRPRVESGFQRIRRLVAGDGRAYWELTTRTGTRHLFGQTAASRQDDPVNPARIFRWSLDRVEDTGGNSMVLTYAKDSGQIYPATISYAGSPAHSPTHVVRFLLEARYDVSVEYSRGFGVSTQFRLFAVDVSSAGKRVGVHRLYYETAKATARSRLTGVQQLGSDAVVVAAAKGGSGSTSGSALRPTTFGYFDGGTPSLTSVPVGPPRWVGGDPNTIRTGAARLLYGDFNGDGRTDIAALEGTNSQEPVSVYLSNGDGFEVGWPGPALVWISQEPNWAQENTSRVSVGDFNGDGKGDFAVVEGADGWRAMSIYLSTGQGFAPRFDGPVRKVGHTIEQRNADIARVMYGDFNGDGKTDILAVEGEYSCAAMNLYLSQGTSFSAPIPGPQRCVGRWGGLAPITTPGVDLARIKLGDFNGDGRMDVAAIEGWGNALQASIYLSNGAGFDPPIPGPAFPVAGERNWASVDLARIQVGDFNGDGKADFYRTGGGPDTCGTSAVYLSTGGGFAGPFGAPTQCQRHYIDQVQMDVSRVKLGDFNGDGLTDLAVLEGADSSSPMSIHLSTGTGFFRVDGPPVWIQSNPDWGSSSIARFGFADFNGDGKTDVAFLAGSNGVTPMSMCYTPVAPADFLASIRTPAGALTRLEYAASTGWSNPLLPFPVQTLARTSVYAEGGTDVESPLVTSYAYAGGYYHVGQREFRGFSHARVSGPQGPSGEGEVTETWFHQGDELVPDANDPTSVVGRASGKAYRTRVTRTPTGESRNTVTTYAAGSASPPYFNPVARIEEYACRPAGGLVEGVCGRQTRVTYGYDAYGNVTREDRYGALSDASDDRTVVRTYQPNVGAWIVGLPARESVYEGTYPSVATEALDPGVAAAHLVARTDFFYDGPSDCSGPGGSPSPVKGRLTSEVGWLNGGDSPVRRMGHDAYGNLVCARDANGNLTTYAYDATATYRKKVTNALRQPTTTEYYGVDGVPADRGSHGQVKSETDANGATATAEYDVFGRPKRAVAPDGSWKTFDYVEGVVWSQCNVTTASSGLATAIYYDGLGRTFYEQTQATEAGRVIAVVTEYDSAGRVARASRPYFQGTEKPRWTTFLHDGAGRVTSVRNPDGTVLTQCHDDVAGVSAVLDAEGHKLRETRDVHGRLVQVDEYEGKHAVCSTAVGSPTATTRYDHDVMGRLSRITDAGGAVTEIAHDTLGRRISLADPATGNSAYGYEPNGNLSWQQDGRGRVTHFFYDPLNRVVRRDHPNDPDVVYAYDDPAVPFSRGRLTSRTDAAGTSALRYDAMGRVTSTARQLGGVWYTTTTGYDGAGRVSEVGYPDGHKVAYQYDPEGQLGTVAGDGIAYAALRDYNAREQVGTIVFGNGVTTRAYYSNDRLARLYTAGAAGAIVDLTYAFDGVGHVKAITDAVDPLASGAYAYDGLGRLVLSEGGGPSTPSDVSFTFEPLRPSVLASASDGRRFSHDAAGNMVSDGSRALTYDDAGRVSRVATAAGGVSFTYDATGERVRKEGPASSVLYVGRLYECTRPAGGAPSCVRHVFAAGRRIASVAADGAVRYYHADHLEATRAVTDAAGTVRERIRYAPFGAAEADTAAAQSRYKYTGQELDPESGLYHYGARYYDPTLYRFVSPDAVAGWADPQMLNRYSYVRNAPLDFVDPTGHWPNWNKLWKKATDPKVALAVQVLLPGTGTLLLMATPQGRNIVGTEAIVVAAAACTVASNGACAPALVGAVVGGGAGAYDAHRTGGDETEGMLAGAWTGFACGLAASAAGAPVGAGASAMGLSPWAAGALGGAVAGGYGGYLQAERQGLDERGRTKAVLLGAAAGAISGGIAGGIGDEPLVAGQNWLGFRYPNQTAWFVAGVGSVSGMSAGLAVPRNLRWYEHPGKSSASVEVWVKEPPAPVDGTPEPAGALTVGY